MTVIELSDEHAAALKAKAAADGLTLEAWLTKLAASEQRQSVPFRLLPTSFLAACAMCHPK
jgi:cytochrome c553